MKRIAMRRLGLGLFLSVLMMGLATIPAWGVNNVTIVSDTTAASAKDTVFIKLTNDAVFAAVTVPLVFRQITLGSFIRDTLRGDRNPNDRLTLKHDLDADTALGSLNGIKIFNKYNVPDGNCKLGFVGGFKTPTAASYPGPWQSDSAAVFFSYAQMDPTDLNDKLLQPGTDTAGGALRLIFTVTSTEGRFEIDTTCTNPANHLLFMDTFMVGVTPTFMKGYVQIGPIYDNVQYLGGDGVPRDYNLEQNYPNPFNASTVIKFNTRHDGHVRLDVFNILGQKVRTLVDEVRHYGPQAADWDGTDVSGQAVPTGLYFYRLVTQDYTAVKKMVLIK